MNNENKHIERRLACRCLGQGLAVLGAGGQGGRRYLATGRAGDHVHRGSVPDQQSDARATLRGTGHGSTGGHGERPAAATPRRVRLARRVTWGHQSWRVVWGQSWRVAPAIPIAERTCRPSPSQRSSRYSGTKPSRRRPGGLQGVTEGLNPKPYPPLPPKP